MKNIIFIFLISSSFAAAQNLNLRNPITKDIELPQILNKNDVGIVYEINGGWSAYDYINYFIIDSKGIITSYTYERPKAYLKNDKLKKSLKKVELTQERKDKIFQLLNSEQLFELLKYGQEDFKISSHKNRSPPCFISDANGYKFTIIQDNRENSYSYYAPKYHYENCPDKTINKKVLKKFIDVINLL